METVTGPRTNVGLSKESHSRLASAQGEQKDTQASAFTGTVRRGVVELESATCTSELGN